ncbi:MAG: methyltransferase, partial [Oscillospiraceae bacterium]
MCFENWELLGKNLGVYITREHGFTTDTLLLANFCKPAPKSICADFGSGCGTIALLWAAQQQAEKIFAVELQEQAVLQAEASVRRNGFANVEIRKADINDYKRIFAHQQLDLIACNPPYKAEGAGRQNPEMGKRLARHEKMLTLEELACAAAFSLKFGGKLSICQRPERLTDALVSFRKFGLEPKRLRLVQQHGAKPPSLFLLECRRGGNPGLQILPTRFVEEK